MAFTGGNYIINLETNVAPIQAAMQSLGATADQLMNRVRAAASAPVNIPVNVVPTQNLQAGIQSRFDQLASTVAGGTFIGGPGGSRLPSAALQRDLEEQIAGFRNFVTAQSGGFRQPRVTGDGSVVAGGFAASAERQAAANAVIERFIATATELTNVQAAAAGLQRRQNAVTIRAIEEEAENAAANQLNTVATRQDTAATRASAAVQRVTAVPANRSFGQGFGDQITRSGGAGGFLGSGLASTLRFAIPSVALFGAARAIGGLVRQAEELDQIFVRLDAQFQALGARGLFGGSNPEQQAENARRALEQYREELFEISEATGLATDETAELGQRFIGLFSSIESSTGNVQGLAREATEITAQFAVITGLSPEETFNDLAGAVRSFAETGEDTVALIDDLTGAVINVSDVTGVAAGEITDFVGRIGPAAAQAGLQLEEITALAATALQGSGVGGAALAEQFGRVLTGLQGELGTELADLATEFEDTFAQIDGAATFNLDNIFAGNVDDVLIGLINGFDALSDAQQRQIVASVGSRREGAALAAVLQNASTFNTALSAATDQNVSRQERFDQIIERLTGRLNRLRSEITVLGQRLFDAGLAEFVSGVRKNEP